ncbi:hypothetical protein GCM10009765_25560 [Fodinicola feengrottensis]|uniref:Phage capsid-like C-terminal domain-containing protein n=2 Tax=Fodinicola feengrottensis TaxID=435914 RepID=A0ABN2GQF0_9ACTN
MLLDDPELRRRGPGEEFALARARMGDKASVTLRAAISDLFPPAQRRPRYTVRHLLRKAVIGTDSDEITVFRERAAPDDESAAPEWGFQVGITATGLQTITAAVPVPDEILADPAALAAFVDFRLLVRLGTAENDVLLNGKGGDGILGLLHHAGVRKVNDPAGTVADTLIATAALCERHGGSADGMVLHPDDWWPLLGDGFLDRLTSAGVKVSRTRMVPPGTAVVGDFTAAATLLDRRQSTIRMAREGELGIGGAGIVAEIQEGLAVHLPGHFVVAQLPTVGAIKG